MLEAFLDWFLALSVFALVYIATISAFVLLGVRDPGLALSAIPFLTAITATYLFVRWRIGD